MRFRTIFTIVFLTVCWALPMQAQEDDTANVLTAAEEAYRIGRIEEARDMLENKVQNLESTLRLRGYRLLSLCCLALDQPQQARSYAELMLGEDPYYTPTVDYPPRFMDMVADIKRGATATITTASSQAESLSEVPVPTTLITEEMIRNCGGTNLQEVLAAYVPGMHLIDCNNDINIAMRGIYSNSQEKILIMLNGHRLNSYATNIAAPDYGISLEKIRQIEVLRGPASSIYGGVALTAVVNIITKQGGDVDGLQVKAGAGNHGQLQGGMLFGKRYFDLDILAWGNLYRNGGEERILSRGIYFGDTITIGRIGNKPSYDFGVQLSWKGLQLLYNSHFSQVVAPFVMSTMGATYKHDKYRTYKGYFPSFATAAQHIDLSYSRQFGRLNLNGAVTYDRSDFTHYQVIYDHPLSELPEIFPVPSDQKQILSEYGGLSRYINGQERDYGVRLKADLTYVDNDSHKGSIVGGVEANRFDLEDLCYQYGYDFTRSLPEDPRLQALGHGYEEIYNTFLQLKHRWHSLILNAGLRYDYKHHSNSNQIEELSPRMALILLRPKWNVKLSYSKSFVDAPYLYRTLNAFDETLSEEKATSDHTDNNEEFSLSPERVHSWQLSFAGLEWVRGLNFEVNAFYNHGKDLIVTNISDYENGGVNKTVGIELMAAWRSPRVTADFNLSWIHTLKNNLMEFDDVLSKIIGSVIDANNNTPAIMANGVVAWQVSKPLKLHAHLLYEGGQTSYNIDAFSVVAYQMLYKMAEDYDKKGNQESAAEIYTEAAMLLQDINTRDEISPRLICNVGAEYQIGSHLTLGLNVRNLFDKDYNRSGMNSRLIPQRGRWWTVTAAWQF